MTFLTRERCFIHWSTGDVFGWKILFWRRLLLSKSKCFITLYNYIYIYYTYNYVSYTYFTVCVEVCVYFSIFLLTSGVSLFVRVAHVMWFMRTKICIMTWVWQVLQGEGDLWGQFQCPHNSKLLYIMQSEFFGGESRNAQSPVRVKFRCRVGVVQLHIQFLQYKNHYAYGESP